MEIAVISEGGSRTGTTGLIKGAVLRGAVEMNLRFPGYTLGADVDPSGTAVVGVALCCDGHRR